MEIPFKLGSHPDPVTCSVTIGQEVSLPVSLLWQTTVVPQTLQNFRED